MNKINVGCGGFPVEDALNIDLFPPADVLGDFRTMEFWDMDEITMYHVLEHLPWREAPDAIRLLRKWLRPGGKLVVEVPDMRKIMGQGTHPANWVQYVYGAQDHEGEFHKSGYTQESLYELVAGCGFRITHSRTFLSDVSARVGFPCVSVTGVRS